MKPDGKRYKNNFRQTLSAIGHGCLYRSFDSAFSLVKVSRILDTIDLNRYDEIVAYGDSPGDLPMLELAKKEERYYRPFGSFNI